MTVARIRFLLATIALSLGAPAPVSAHAFLDHAVPSVGGKVRAPPGEVTLRFTEKLEPAFCSVRVLDARGERVDKADARVDGGDPALLRVSLRAIPAGRYKVIWRVVSVDTHVTEGDFTFEVAP
jgi:methionine-rich copper-binding protein CopC